MKHTKSLVAVISVILFLSVLLLGANTVFSVSKVEIEYTLSSDQAYEDAEALHNALNEKFVGENILFLREENVRSQFDEYPYLNVTGVEKQYPDTVKLFVEEKLEVFALVRQGENAQVYAMADKQGNILRESSTNQNNVDGGENVSIEGLTYSAQKGFQGDAHFQTAIDLFTKAAEKMGSVRGCFTRLQISSNAVRTVFTLYTREGVYIEIDNPAQATDEKITSALNLFLSLKDNEKLYGYITVLEVSGRVTTTYTPRG